MSDPMERSLQGTSQFIAFQSSMEQSMCGMSQKIPIENASTVNRKERERDLKDYHKIKGQNTIKEVDEGDEENQFLNVGKWNKSKKPQASIIKQQQPPSEPQQKTKKPIQPTKQEPSKWDKRKSIDSSNKSITNKAQQHVKEHIHHEQVTNSKKQIPHHIDKSKHGHLEHTDSHRNSELEQDQEEEEEDEDEEQEEEEEEEQEEEEQEQEQEQQEQQEEDEDDDEQGDKEDEQNQQIEQQQEQQEIEDKFATGGTNQFQQSSQAIKTETVNTSAINKTPQTSKWNKKKAPLDTMTKYETKQTNENGGKKFHSRLNSASGPHNEEIYENIVSDEWSRVEKILMRLKLLLS